MGHSPAPPLLRLRLRRAVRRRTPPSRCRTPTKPWPGRRTSIPTGSAAATEQALRSVQHPTGSDLLDATPRTLALNLAAAGRELPVVTAVVLPDRQIDGAEAPCSRDRQALTPQPAPTDPIRPHGDHRRPGWRWRTARVTVPSPAARDARPAPTPVRPGARQHPAVAAGPRRTGLGEEAVRRGPARLTALFWSHINPYGIFRLDMDKRLDLLPALVLGPRRAPDDGVHAAGSASGRRTGATPPPAS